MPESGLHALLNRQLKRDIAWVSWAFLPATLDEMSECEQGKISCVQMITQVEHLGKPSCCPKLVLPGAILALSQDQIVNALSNAPTSGVARSKQAQDCPRRLRGCAWPSSLEARVVVAVRQSTPPPVRILNRLQPASCCLEVILGHVFTATLQSAKNEPGAVDIVASPSPKPGPVALLLPE